MDLGDYTDNDIVQAVEALLNIAAQAAEMQVTEEGREAVYAILNFVAAHHGIEVAEVEEEELEDGSIHVRFKDSTTTAKKRTKPKLSVIQGGAALLDDAEPDDDEPLH